MLRPLRRHRLPRLQWTPGLRPSNTTLVTVRWEILDQRDEFTADCARLAKRRRALVETNPPRNSQLKFIEADGAEDEHAGGEPDQIRAAAVGTIFYMSPEQNPSEQATPRLKHHRMAKCRSQNTLSLG
jgi:hypothetical protein